MGEWVNKVGSWGWHKVGYEGVVTGCGNRANDMELVASPEKRMSTPPPPATDCPRT